MKKLATILMLVAAILVGGMTADAKTTKKKTAKTSSTAVAKAQLLDNNVCSYFTFSSKGTYSWGDNGGCDSGPYMVDGDAYILASGRQGVYVLVNNGMYHITYDVPGADPLIDWLASNGYGLTQSKMKQIFSFDKGNLTLRYNVDGQSRSVKLSGADYDAIKWVKK